MKKETIYLDVDDDITTIIDKVESAKEKIVALVLPKRFAALQSIVNMRLLKRSADSAGKNVVLVTAESALLPLAGAAGIMVSKSLQSQPEIPPLPADLPPEKPAVPVDPDAEVDAKDAKLDYHRSIGELAAGAEAEPETIPLEDAEEEKATKRAATKPSRNKRSKIPNFERFRLLLAAGIAAFIAFIVFIILAIFVWPKAIITLQTEATPISASFQLNTSDSAKSLDENKGIIPAVLKTSDLTSNQQVQATGQQNNGNKASGTVSLKNCTGSAVTVPAGTGISSGGLTFITQKSASLDSGNFDIYGNCKSSGGHIGNVDVVAQQGGSKYNLAAGQTFSVSGQPSGVTAGNSNAFSGGTDNVVTVLAQSDVDGAKSKITDQDKTKFTDNFKKQLSDQNFYIIASTLKAADPVVNASPAVGQPAAAASVSIKITYSVLVVQKNDLKKAITDELNKQIDQSRQKIGTDDVLQGAAVAVQSQSSPTAATLSISESTTAVPTINTTAIAKQVGGKKAGEIKSLLSDYPGVKNVDVRMSPFWVSKAPKKTSRIHIVLQQVKDNTP